MSRFPFFTVTSLTLKMIQHLLQTNAYPVSLKQAKRIRDEARRIQSRNENVFVYEAYPRDMVKLLREVDEEIMHACGHECMRLRAKTRDNHDYFYEYCHYVNTGDPYNTTLFWWRGKFRIGSWGDLVERYDHPHEY